jgi:nucleotide-binding universal stress UspA family protein
VTVSAGGSDESSLDRVRLGAHLARHGIRSQHREVPGNRGYVANALLSYIADADSDLLVMGAYGHSRFREMVLGGATRGVLASMTVPVLMSY